MINQYEVVACLADDLPEIKDELVSISPKLNVFKSLHCLADYTKTKLMQHDMQVVKKCFASAEKIYAHGNEIVRGAVENEYVFSFSSLMNMCSREEKIKIQAFMPMSLYTVYIQQILKSGI